MSSLILRFLVTEQVLPQVELSIIHTLLLHVFVGWKLLSYLGTGSQYHTDHQSEFRLTDTTAHYTANCMCCNTNLQGNLASCQTSQSSLICQRKFNFWGLPVKRKKNKQLGVYLWIAFGESQIIRSFPLMHIIWINFQPLHSAMQLLIIRATLSSAGNNNVKQAHEPELRWAPSHLLEPQGLCLSFPTASWLLNDTHRQNETQTLCCR